MQKITSIPFEFNDEIKELHILESLKITTLFIDSKRQLLLLILTISYLKNSIPLIDLYRGNQIFLCEQTNSYFDNHFLFL